MEERKERQDYTKIILVTTIMYKTTQARNITNTYTRVLYFKG